MENPFKRSSKEQAQVDTRSITLTARMFFGLDGDKPYTSPSEFLAYGESLRSKEGSDLNKVVECMASGMKMNGNPSTGIDAGGRPYTFHQAYKAKAIVGYKVINGGGIPQLINDYQDGLITIAFTLTELVDIAMEA